MTTVTRFLVCLLLGFFVVFFGGGGVVCVVFFFFYCFTCASNVGSPAKFIVDDNAKVPGP